MLFRRPATARRKGDHQDGAIAQIAQAVAATGCQQLRQDVTGHRLGALAAALPRHGSDGKTKCRLQGKVGEGAV